MSIPTLLLLLSLPFAGLTGYLYGYDRGHRTGAHDVLSELNRSRRRETR